MLGGLDGGMSFQISDDAPHPYTNPEPSVCALFYFIRAVKMYEPALLDEIEAVVATRGLTETERDVENALGQFEDVSLTV